MRKAWGVAPHERVVLPGGRADRLEGPESPDRGGRQAARRGASTDVSFVLAGDPQGRDAYVRELDTLIASRGLKGCVRRVGHCTDMPAAFLAAAVVTVPSTEPEAFGRAAVEAQAMGTPVVVSDLGAVPETVLSPPAVPPQERTGWRVRAMPVPWPRRSARRWPSVPPPGPRSGAGRAPMWSVTSPSSSMVASTLDVYSALLEGRLGRHPS